MRTLALLLSSALLGACGASVADPAKSALDQVVELRMSLGALRTEEGATPFAPDLERSASLLNQAELALGKGDSDPVSVELLIELAHSQLVLIKSALARARAVEALERTRGEYADTDERIRELEALQDELGSTTGVTR